MENETLNTKSNKQNSYRQPYRRNTGLGAFIIIIVGVVLLLRRIPQTAHIFPNWLFDWSAILIAAGLFVGVRCSFRNSAWLILIIIGTFFLLRNNNILGSSWDLYALPVFLIIAGFLLLFRRNRWRNRRACRGAFHFEERMRRKHEFWQQRGQRFNDKFYGASKVSDNSSEDFVEVNSVFGNSEKTMFTKTFKGGNISVSFGGAELRLSQSDMEESAVINIDVTFGGVEISVPANWTIQNELSAVMGGIEDKRKMSAPVVPPKILILKGRIFCGGVEIKN